MTTNDNTRVAAAKIAGLGLIFAIVLVIVANYSVNMRLILPDNAVDTAKNIVANKTAFRINVVCNVFFVVCNLALLVGLYIFFQPVNRVLSMIASLCRLSFALIWGMTAIGNLGVMRLLGTASYLTPFETSQLQTMARLNLASAFDAYYIALSFWGIASTLISHILYQSRMGPKGLSLFGLAASGWCVFCGAVYLIFPGFSKTVDLYAFDVPLVIFELWLGGWLFLKAKGKAFTT